MYLMIDGGRRSVVSRTWSVRGGREAEKIGREQCDEMKKRLPMKDLSKEALRRCRKGRAWRALLDSKGCGISDLCCTEFTPLVARKSEPNRSVSELDCHAEENMLMRAMQKFNIAMPVIGRSAKQEEKVGERDMLQMNPPAVCRSGARRNVDLVSCERKTHKKARKRESEKARKKRVASHPSVAAAYCTLTQKFFEKCIGKEVKRNGVHTGVPLIRPGLSCRLARH
ncbi:uncharacterized protein MEPE_01887 [Melanopsichium pennsylvanicum]|uniref:Uncharacterized protein n=1 Tax=Melanopsichium pennsylvanicum TaxID=63383 RepID=A0AAJ4XJP3_9BASI|nr:uncharacterized protein MEPE_01887 [Melanopsichium pennsylvanicum]